MECKRTIREETHLTKDALPASKLETIALSKPNSTTTTNAPNANTKTKKWNPGSNLKIKTTNIPHEPIEESEIENEFEKMRLIMRERGLEANIDPDSITPENYYKNRYHDVLPNQDTRVKLTPQNDGSGDYINANHVSDKMQPDKSAQQYICCQAPLPNTFDDFWRMVWEKNCPVIVMLTKLEEKNRIKADLYWPEKEKESKQYGHILVTHKKTKVRIDKVNSGGNNKGGVFSGFSKSFFGGNKGNGHSNNNSNSHNSSSINNNGNHHSQHIEYGSKEATIIIRKFSLVNVKEPRAPTREVVQLHYTEWPDFGVPESTERMADLIRELDIRKKGLEDPIVVHCSAGIGRTGTFLAIHMALQKAASRDPDIDVLETVINLRVQRNGMVQSVDQYKFVYVTIKDMLQDKYNKYAQTKSRRGWFYSTQTSIDEIRGYIDKVPKNRPTRSASEPIIEDTRTMSDDEIPTKPSYDSEDF